MKKLSTLTFFLLVAVRSFAQNNPVENLTWNQWYQTPDNFFELTWTEPAQPHNDLVGYNIYRNNELYRFQTETSLYNIYSPVYGFVSNCDLTFLELNNQNEPYEFGFEVHVTAVYNPGQTESVISQSFFVTPPALGDKNYTQKQLKLFPNPTNGILNIENGDFIKIVMYDLTGKVVKKSEAASKLDLSDLPKGIYIIRLFSEKAIAVDKIIID